MIFQAYFPLILVMKDFFHFTVLAYCKQSNIKLFFRSPMQQKPQFSISDTFKSHF